MSLCDIEAFAGAVSHEAIPAWRCGQSAATSKWPPWLNSKAAVRTVIARNRLCIVVAVWATHDALGEIGIYHRSTRLPRQFGTILQRFHSYVVFR